MFKCYITIFWDKEPYKAPIFYARSYDELETDIRKYLKANFTAEARKHLSFKITNVVREAI